MKTVALVLLLSVLSFLNPVDSHALSLAHKVVFDLTSSISDPLSKEFGYVSFLEYDGTYANAVFPGESLLGPDYLPGTSDDIQMYGYYYWGPGAYFWDLELVDASSNIVPSFVQGQTYYGQMIYDGGGAATYSFPGVFEFAWIDDWFTPFNNSFPVVSHGPTFYESPVPEPATFLLLGIGIALLVGSRIRKKK